MKKFLIRREMEGASNVPKAEFNKGGKASEAILEEMRNEGKMIQQEQSYVAGNNVFCVYNAESEDLIHEHAKRSNGIVSEVTEITTVIRHNTSVVS
jgi:hypothetical protein|tara:strand:+ start:146 stop:433 length:288 start_codon:yes stop_codon:yes gene_type:complete